MEASSHCDRTNVHRIEDLSTYCRQDNSETQNLSNLGFSLSGPEAGLSDSSFNSFLTSSVLLLIIITICVKLIRFREIVRTGKR
jgi:hypothetical protein